MNRFIRVILRCALIGLFRIAGWVPLSWSSALTSGLVFLLSPFLKGYRRVAMNNLQQAYPQETSPKFFSQIISGCFRNVGLIPAEIAYLARNPDAMLTRVSVQGIEHLDAALACGKGVVAVTAHLGNFPLMMTWFSRKGFATGVILKPPRDRKADDYLMRQWNDIRGPQVIYAMPRMKCIHESLKLLRDNGLLFILPDQNFGDDGRVFVRFFGRLAATGAGSLAFARRSGAAIVPMFIIRNADGTHRIIIERPLDIKEMPVEQQTQLVNTQAFTQRIEEHIRRSPEQWLWFHKRWKTQPVDTDVVISA